MSQSQRKQLPEVRRGKVSSLISDEEKELYSDELPRASVPPEPKIKDKTELAPPAKAAAAAPPNNKVRKSNAESPGAETPKSKKNQVMVYFDDELRLKFERMLMEGAFLTLQREKKKFQQTELVALMTRHFFSLFENDRKKFDELVLETVGQR